MCFGVLKLHRSKISGEKPLKDEIKKTWVINRYGVRTFRSKVTVCLIAGALSLALVLIFVYIVIPGIIQGISDQIDEHLADQLYDTTLTADSSSVSASPASGENIAPAFVQPDEPAKTPLVPRTIFGDALAENPDVVGRISIASLGINYLVVQASDNEHYLKTGYDGKPSRNGAIFLDSRCDAKTEPLKGNLILYGHNMKSGKMFHTLMQYKDKSFFYANRFIRFDTLYRDYTWEIFSVYVTSVDFNYTQTSFKDESEWSAYLNTVQGKSMFPTDTVLSPDDVVLTLSTCTYEFDNARFVVQARLVK